MPPARKKGGANCSNNNNININNNNKKLRSVIELQLGDLVLAKVKGFPAWPAKVSRPEDWERTPDPKKHFVQFFGTREIAFVAPADIQAFTSESKTKVLARCKGKTVKYFAQAVKEICEAFEESQKHSDIRGAVRLASNVNDGKINGSYVESTEVLKSGDSCQINDKQTAAMKDSISHRHENIKMKKESNSSSPVLVQALFSAPSLFSHSNEGTAFDENKNDSACRECSTGTKDTSMLLEGSDHLKFSAGEDKKSAIRDMSKDIKVGAKRKVEGVLSHANDAKSGGYFGDGTLGKVSAGGHAKRLALDSNKFEVNAQGKASKNLLKCPKLSDVAKSSPLILVTNAEGPVDSKNPRQTNGQSGNDQSLSVKKAKLVDITSNAPKGSVLKNGKSDLEAEMVDEEGVPLVVKRRHHALSAGSNNGKRILGINSKNDVPKKRRAVRLCDDDEPKTPVHGGSIKYAVKVGSSALISDSVKKTHENNVSYIRAGQNSKGVNRDEGGFLKDYHPSAKPAGESSLGATLSLKAGSFAKVSVSHTSGLEALDKRVVKESKTDLISPIKFPQVVAGVKKSADQQKPNKPFDKVTGSVSQIKAQCVSGKDPIGMPCGSRFSQSQVSAQKTRQPISEQRAKIPPKIGVELTEQAAFIDNHKDNDSEVDGRLEDTRGKSGSLVDSNLKNLIAAAQAKMRLAHMHNVPHGGGDSLTAPSANLLGRSPTPSSTHQAFLSCGGNVTQLDAQGVKPLGSFTSPSDRTLWLGSQESEEKELILGHQSAGRALSGGTEAAVARDAFEGMIETLSRTKESIGRATRLAIDCAKYGIANEILDLLIHKLENESSLPRKVDLFFLADSITQCSHSQKGIAGASYLPAVQASLPRLLGGAAPPGPNARENRRQCLKVLRLWVERKILPESVVRRFMDDIEGSNDDTSTGVSYKRPSRADRSVDDPIREMEGMFVDEYGSNATFNLPGFLTAHGFADDEEDGDDIPSTLHNQSEASPLQPCTKALIGPETGIDTPNDRCHHILEDVDGELEMEDVSGHPKRGALSPYGFSKIDEQELQLDTEVDPSTYNIVEPLSLHDSPPLPLESPPPLPPLPSSPHPPPPPPLSPSPPPPPPPPSTLLSQPSLPSFLSSGPSQAGNLQQLVPLQSSVTPQAVLHPPVAIPSVQVRHAVQMAGNTSQQMPHFMPPGPSISRPLEYGQTDMYPGPQAGPSNQQFQPSQATFVQRAFPQVSLPQPRLGPFVYNQPLIQRHLPHPRSHLPAFPPPPSHPYSASNSEGLRRFSDEQWRSAPAEYKADNHYNAWVNGGRPQSCPTTTFIGEAYFQPPEGGLTDHLRHNSSVPNSAMGGPSLSGHVINQMLPSRPDMSSLSCWRPV